MPGFVLDRARAVARHRAVRWVVSPAGDAETSAVIRWWESRRPVYNLVILVAGGVNLLLFFLVLAAERRYLPTLFAPPAHPVLQFIEGVPFPVLLAALGANAVYTLGWVGDLAARRLWQTRAARFGPAAWVAGTTLSVMVTFSLLTMNLVGCAWAHCARYYPGAV